MGNDLASRRVKSAGPVGRPGAHLRLHAIKVFVRDQDQSLRFFVDLLGFQLAFDARLQSGDRWVAVAPPHGTAVLTLITPKPESEEYALIGRSTEVVFVTENVTLQYAEWRKRGVRFLYAPRLRRVTYDRQQVPSTANHEPSPVWGGVFTRFRDVDGNLFELVGFDELTQELEAQKRAVAEKLESERRAAQELEIAKQVQARLFPQTMPEISTLEYAGICIQARQVGGDYYDFLDLGQEQFAFVVGDISGKGIAAALLMANLQANLRSQCAIALDNKGHLLESVNRMFYENTTGSAYATLFFARYEDHGGRLRYTNCGHLPALLLRSDNTIEKLDSTCTVVGLFPEWDCATAECRLLAGDTLVLYTDGVTEAFNEAEEDFGEKRLMESVRRHRALPSQELAASIVADVQKFSAVEQHDDITLIVAKCRAKR
jgi:serine phosphatase RsbU (regulator of sigma subunit)/catechol 2,3-dioxygenase-like lactoylglutathione lyase family enzyme